MWGSRWRSRGFENWPNAAVRYILMFQRYVLNGVYIFMGNLHSRELGPPIGSDGRWGSVRVGAQESPLRRCLPGASRPHPAAVWGGVVGRQGVLEFCGGGRWGSYVDLPSFKEEAFFRALIGGVV